jgi:hypothetical protein
MLRTVGLCVFQMRRGCKEQCQKAMLKCRVFSPGVGAGFKKVEMMIRPVLVFSNKNLPILTSLPAAHRVAGVRVRLGARKGLGRCDLGPGNRSNERPNKLDTNKNRPFTESKRPVDKTGCGGRI